MPDMMAVHCMSLSHRVQPELYRHMLHPSVQVRASHSAPRRTGLRSHVLHQELRFTTEEALADPILYILVHSPSHLRQQSMHMPQEAGTDRAIPFPGPVHIRLRSVLHHLFLRVKMLSHSPVRHLVRLSIIRVVESLAHVRLADLLRLHSPAQ